MQARSGLDPYRKYLKRIRDYYEKSEIMLDYRPHRQRAGYWANLGELGENELSLIYDMKEDHVYEFDPHVNDKFKPKQEDKIKIIKRDAGEKTLQLERKPTKPKLVIRRNSYPIAKQLGAVTKLLFEPSRGHITLLKLFHKNDVEWPAVNEQRIDEWFVLTEERDGIREQREFVKRALGTPDFAFLEGPPGSGKTTVLCELVQQIVSRGKRVLFCASTHVAVDNLLERLVDENARPMADLIPLRIGESDRISEKTQHYKYDNYVETKKNELLRHLSGKKSLSRAQSVLQKTLEENDDTVGQIARECANLVCGTAIGILQHPDIKDGPLRRFDFMIIDEASKTTLQEFLVPALHADRWIIVGDTKQLSPHTDDAEVALHMDSCIEKTLGESCLDVFTASRRRCTNIVITNDKELKHTYREQCEKLGVEWQDADTGSKKANSTSGLIVTGTPASMARVPPQGIDRIGTIRNYDQLLGELRRKKDTGRMKEWTAKYGQRSHENDTWGQQIGWRVRSLPPDAAQYSAGQKIEGEINDLMPSGGNEAEEKLGEVKAIALPSVLECLEKGTGVASGIPGRDFEDRHVRLVWQYRMHPDVAAFSHRHVYGETALHTPGDMESKRSWTYGEYGNRSVWINVRGKVDRSNGSFSNKNEAEQIVRELAKFCGYARGNPKPDGTRWEVAVLSFYTGQRALLQKLVQKFTGKQRLRSFEMQAVRIELHTVDSFQGQEADLVFLSLVRDRSTIFLNNINRINVAITRARYQRVIVGNKKAMLGADPPLHDLADETPDQEQI